MLLPKKAKYRRQFKGRVKGRAQRGSSLAFGEFGLKVLEKGRLSSRQIEAARKSISRVAKRGGKLWIRVFPDKPVTKKPSEVRMGGGKGPVDHYVAVVRPGRIVFEIAGIDEETATKALKTAAQKLPVKAKVVKE